MTRRKLLIIGLALAGFAPSARSQEAASATDDQLDGYVQDFVGSAGAEGGPEVKPIKSAAAVPSGKHAASISAKPAPGYRFFFDAGIGTLQSPETFKAGPGQGRNAPLSVGLGLSARHFELWLGIKQSVLPGIPTFDTEDFGPVDGNPANPSHFVGLTEIDDPDITVREYFNAKYIPFGLFKEHVRPYVGFAAGTIKTPRYVRDVTTIVVRTPGQPDMPTGEVDEEQDPTGERYIQFMGSVLGGIILDGERFGLDLRGQWAGVGFLSKQRIVGVSVSPRVYF